MDLGEVQLHGSLSGGCSLMVVGAGIVRTGAAGALLGIALSPQGRLCALSTWPSLGFLAAWGPWGNQMASWWLRAPGQYRQLQSGRRITFDDLALEFTQAALPHTLLVNTVRKTFQEPRLRELDTTS